jgi:hypothetical protein
MEDFEAQILEKLRQAAEKQKQQQTVNINTPQEAPTSSTEQNNPTNVENIETINNNFAGMDFESVTMMKLRQAAERQQLEKEMLKHQQTNM